MSGPLAPAAAAGLADEIAAGCRPLPSLPELIDRDELPARPHAVVVVPPDPADPALGSLLERAEWLQDSGFDVTVVHHHELPSTSATTLKVAPGLDLVTAMPRCDVIVVGSWSQSGTARAFGIAPVAHLVADTAALGVLPAGNPATEHTAEEHAAHVTAALRAADLTVTVTAGAQAALRARHGVESHVVRMPAPGASGPAAPAASRETGSTLHILQFGWDGDAEAGAARGRQAVADLRAGGHDARLTLVMKNWPVQPLREGEERVPLPRTAEGTAALLDAADVVLVPGTDASRDTHVLAAFSRGVPVIATHCADDDLLTDGVDSLVAEADALTGALVRIATDPSLAASLGTGGLATAARYSLAAQRERFTELLRPLTARQVESSGAAWNVEAKGLDFDGGPAALQELRDRLPTIAAGQVAIPVRRPVFGGHQLVRWTVVARRKGAQGTLRVFLPASAAGPDAKYRWRDGLKALAWNRPEAAVRYFVGAYRTAPPAAQPLLWRWIAVAALGIGHADDAMEAAASGLAVWPDHPDFHYLAGMAAAARGDDTTAAAEWEQVRAIGSAVCRYDEWFADTEKLLAARLGNEAGRALVS